MNKENQQVVSRAVGLAGDILMETLPPSPRHPAGRNGYAHVWLGIKHRFGDYKLLPDGRLQEVLDYVLWVVQNPS